MKPGGKILQLSFFSFIHSSHLACDPFQPTQPGSASGKEPACQCRKHERSRFNPWVRKIPWRRKWQPTPVFLPGKSHGQRSLAGYSPRGHKESDTIETTQQRSPSAGDSKLLWVHSSSAPYLSHITFKFKVLLELHPFPLNSAKKKEKEQRKGTLLSFG